MGKRGYGPVTPEWGLEEGWYKPNERDGMCYCGCNQKAPIATQTDRRRGWIVGYPIQYIRGHRAKATTDETRAKMSISQKKRTDRTKVEPNLNVLEAMKQKIQQRLANG